MRITALEPSGRGKLLLQVDSRVLGGLYRGEVEKLSLEEGMEIDGELYRQLCRLLVDRGKRRVFHLLGRKDYTIAEILAKLRKGRLDEGLAGEVAGYFISLGYLDDAAYTAKYLRAWRDTRSLKQIRFDLSRKGIDRSILDEALKEEPVDEMASAARLYEKKKQALARRDPEVDPRKVGEYLMRKGYSYAVVGELMRRDSGGRDLL